MLAAAGGGAAPAPARRAPTPRPPRPRCATSRAPRTTTAAGAARPASPRPSCTRAGPRSGSPPPAATRATSAAPPRSTTSARHAGELGDLGELSRTILVFRAAGLSPRDVGGRDLVAELLRKRKANGSFAGPREHDRVRGDGAEGDRQRDEALRGAGRWIAGQANPDGGFNFAGNGGPSGIDDTGAAIQGLVAAGRKRTRTVARAARFIVARQNADGGFPLVPGGESNAQSTAWAVQGLLAAGRDPAKVRRSRDPLAYLRSLTSPSGEVRYSRTSRQTPAWVTAQAVMAVARKPLPIKPVARRSAARRSPRPPPPTAPARATRARKGSGTAHRARAQERGQAPFLHRARVRGA